MWQDWSPEQEQPEEEEADEAGPASSASASTRGGAAAASREVTVTEVASGSEFYIQFVGEPRVNWIAEQLAAMSLNAASFTPELPAGSLCLAKYTLDDQWYRCGVIVTLGRQVQARAV